MITWLESPAPERVNVKLSGLGNSARELLFAKYGVSAKRLKIYFRGVHVHDAVILFWGC